MFHSLKFLLKKNIEIITITYILYIGVTRKLIAVKRMCVTRNSIAIEKLRSVSDRDGVRTDNDLMLFLSHIADKFVV